MRANNASSTRRHGDVALLAGPGLCFSWVLLAPSVFDGMSTAMRAYPLACAGAALALIACAGAAAQAIARRGDAGGSPMRACAVAGGLACTAATLLFVFAPSFPLRAGAAAVACASGFLLLSLWTFAISRSRTGVDAGRCAIVALGTAAAFQTAMLAAGTAASISGNAYLFFMLEGCLLAALPACAGVLFAHTGAAAQEGEAERKRNGSETPKGMQAPKDAAGPERTTAEGSASTAHAQAFALAGFAASLVTGVAWGFASQPSYYGWESVELLAFAAGCALAAGCGALAHKAGRAAAPPHNGGAILMAALLLTVIGFALVALGMPLALLAAKGLLQAATGSYLCAAALLLAATASRAPHRNLAATAAIGTGLWWAPQLGAFVRKAVGYDSRLFTPLAIAGLAVLACGALAFLALRSASANTPAEAQAEAALPISGSNGSSSAPAGHAARAKNRADDVEKARTVIERSHEEVLAPYGLSPRELQVSQLVLEGYSIASIADKLEITASTVKFHLGNSYRKIGIQSKSQLIALVKEGKSDHA